MDANQAPNPGTSKQAMIYICGGKWCVDLSVWHSARASQDDRRFSEGIQFRSCLFLINRVKHVDQISITVKNKANNYQIVFKFDTVMSKIGYTVLN